MSYQAVSSFHSEFTPDLGAQQKVDLERDRHAIPNNKRYNTKCELNIVSLIIQRKERELRYLLVGLGSFFVY